MSNTGPGGSAPSTGSTLASIRAGIAVGDMRGFQYGQPVRERASVQPATEERPARIRLVRRLAQTLKAAIHPLLFRLNLRMASAVDSSFAASVLLRFDQDVRRRLGQIERDLNDHLCMLRDEVDRCRAETQLIRLKVEDTLSVATLQTGEARSLSERLDGLLERTLIPLNNAVAIRTDAGYVLAPADDDRAIVRLVEASGRPETSIQAVIDYCLSNGGGLIDVGAEDGRLALAAAGLVGREGRVLTFSRTAATAGLIARAAELNNMAWLRAETADPAALALDDVVTAGQKVDVVCIGDAGDLPVLWRKMGRIAEENPQLVIAVRSPAAALTDAASIAFLEAAGLRAWILDRFAPPRPVTDLASACGNDLCLTRGGWLDRETIRP